jgi:hypothetical protein
MVGNSGNFPLEFVPARSLYEAFRQVVTPTGFQTVKNGVLARQATTDIFHLITLAAYKGNQYGFQWGVSLTYMPHRWENELRWHRTLKSARLDLWDRLMDLPQDLNLTRLPPDKSIPSRSHGIELFEQNLEREWQDLKTTIAGWLGLARDLPGVLSMSSQQKQRSWQGPHHWPPPSLVHAFTLSRMGSLREAVTELSEIIGEGVPDPNGLLVSALEKVVAR